MPRPYKKLPFPKTLAEPSVLRTPQRRLRSTTADFPPTDPPTGGVYPENY